MKKILLLILLIAASFQGFSQTPGISYQAVILNPNIKELPGVNAQSSILANSRVAVRFTILDESYTQEYQEYHVTRTDAYGMINLLIGHGSRISASYFEDIQWNGLSKKLKVDLDFSGAGNNFIFLSEQELTFMPQPALGQDAQAILDNTASIAAEVIRATNAEAVIQSNLDAVEAASILADNALQTNIDNLQADVDATAFDIGNLNNLNTTAKDNLVVAINEVNSGKADLASPSLTGTPLAPTAAAGTNTTQIATTAFVTNAIATATIPDATATVKGKIQLAGDLTGTAALPTIANEAIGTSKLADEAVASTKIADNAVITTKILDANVTTAKLADAAVTSAKIADDAVTEDKIADGAIVSSKIATSPSLTGTPLAPTAAAGTNTTQIATTAFVTDAIATATTGNFVDLTTNQTIGGVKTFSNDVVVNGITIGRGAGDDGQNTVLGRDALGTGTGTRNTAIGYGALKDYAGTSFDNNTSVGYANMVRLTTGSGNTSVGAESMLYLLTGSSNTSIGNQSLINTLGNNNIGVGKRSGGTITTGSNNTIIGTDADVLSDDQVNSVAIGFEAVASADNTIQLGNEDITLVNTSGSITSGGVITGASIVKVGGTSSQYLMADGSVSTGPSGVVSGTGTSNYLPKFTDTSTLGNSNIFDSGTNIGIGTSTPSSKFQIGGEGNTDLNLKFDAVSNESSALKFGYRSFQWRLKTKTNSGTLDPFVFSYYNGTTDETRLTITNNSVDVPNNLNITGNTNGTDASFSGNLMVNTNQLSVNSTTGRVGIFTNAPTSMFQIGGNDSHDNQLKYDYAGDQGYLKFAFRNNEFRMHSQSESGVLDNLIFTYFDNATSTNSESLRISRTGLVTINNLRISGGNPSAGKILTSDANGTVSWTDPVSSTSVREVADEFTATASQTSFTLSQTPSANSKVRMYVNGIRISNTAYSTAGATLTYVPANNGGYTLMVGDRIQMDYYY